VREELRRVYGKRVSRKKVARLMREQGLNARQRRKFIPTTNSNHGLTVCENLLNREFHAGQGGEKRVSSYQRYAITYLRTRGGWVYLTVVLDLFDRKVIVGIERRYGDLPYDYPCAGHGVQEPAGTNRPVISFRPRGTVLRPLLP
jgi:hypothetical protein